jgi:hypothetical protein
LRTILEFWDGIQDHGFVHEKMTNLDHATFKQLLKQNGPSLSNKQFIEEGPTTSPKLLAMENGDCSWPFNYIRII